MRNNVKIKTACTSKYYKHIQHVHVHVDVHYIVVLIILLQYCTWCLSLWVGEPLLCSGVPSSMTVECMSVHVTSVLVWLTGLEGW